MRTSCSTAAASLILTLTASASGAQMINLLTLPGTPRLVAPADPSSFTFVVAGSTAPATAVAPTLPALDRIVDETKTRKAGFLIFVGDTIYGRDGQHRAVVGREYADFLKVVDRAGVAAFNAPGDQEMGDATGHPDSHAALWYSQFMKLPFGAFTYGNSRFIVLNTEEQLPPNQRGVSPDLPGLTDGQLTAVQKELEADAKFAHIFVFLHHPLQARDKKDGLQSGLANPLWEMFKKANVSYVVAGHEPTFFQARDPENVTTLKPRKDPDPNGPAHVITAGGGSPMTGSPEKGGFRHCLVFKVQGDKVEVSIVHLDPKPAAS
jgi:hypothetical protein